MSSDKHPKELPRLFLTEMWERFSFYLMLGLLPLYMIADPSSGGLGFDGAKVGLTIGTYMGLVYFTPFIGGLLADRFIGYRKAVIIGAVIMSAGHLSLAFESLTFFYLGLALLIIGNGFFKPNISTMLGRLYPKGSPLRDAGFSIFYLGINLGAFICNFVAAVVRNKYGWHAAFATAGIGLLIGLVIFLTMYRSLERAEIRTDEMSVGGEGLGVLFTKVLPISVSAAILAFWFTNLTWAFFAASGPVIVFYYWLWSTAPKEEKGQIGALLTVALVLVPFWMVFNLNSTVLSFWAEQNTDREVGSAAVVTLKEFDLLEVAPVSYFSNAAPDVARPDEGWLIITDGTSDVVEAAKAKYATILQSEGYRAAGPIPVTTEEYTNVYKHAGSARLERGESLSLANAELFQSINPAWVILLTPLLVGLWRVLRRRNQEPSTPGKIGIGMLVTAGCWLVMLAAVHFSNDGTVKTSPMWLVVAYGVITIGELCLSPVGLSLVTKLAPARLGAVMMGGFFLSIAIGNKLSGVVGGPVWQTLPHDTFFIGLAILMVVFAAVIFKLRGWLNTYMK